MENVNFYVVYVIQFPRGWSWILENLLRYFIISFIFFLGKIRLKNYYLFIKIKITQLKHYSHKNSQAKLDILLCHIIVHEKLKTLHHTYIYIYICHHQIQENIQFHSESFKEKKKNN